MIAWVPFNCDRFMAADAMFRNPSLQCAVRLAMLLAATVAGRSPMMFGRYLPSQLFRTQLFRVCSTSDGTPSTSLM